MIRDEQTRPNKNRTKGALRPTRTILMLPVVFCVAFSAAPARGQCEVMNIAADDGESGDAFGHAVAVEGEFVIVGAKGDDDQGLNAGAAYIFRRDGEQWAEESKLLASDGEPNARFGWSVGISGGAAIVGAYDYQPGGAAYIFRKTRRGWTEEARLVDENAESNDYFGYSVAIFGDDAIVGAYKDDGVGIDSGSAFIYHFDGSTWTEQAKLVAEDSGAEDYFGASVAIGDRVAIIGAPGDDDGGPQAGAAYIYRWNGSQWREECKIIASDAIGWEYFGYPVALSGDVAVVGAYLDDDACPENPNCDSGSAYIFRCNRAPWTEEAKLIDPDGAPGDWFGVTVAIDADTVIIAAPYADGSAENTGFANIYGYDGSTWTHHATLTASDEGQYHSFGKSVGVAGDLAVLGSPGWEGEGEAVGTAYVFDLDPTPGDVDCDGHVGVADLLALLADWGPCPDPPDDCPADINGDGVVNTVDLLTLLGNWG